MKIQLCFTVGTKDHNLMILDKLRGLRDKLEEKYNGDYTVHSCHLPRQIIEEKGFDSTIVDGFDEIFGNKYHCAVTSDNFKQAMSEMNTYRIKTAKYVDRLVILSDEKVSNIALELEYFTDNKVMCI